MKKQALVAIMLISCFMAGCTDADLEDAEQALGCTYSEAVNYNVTAAIDDGSCIYPEPPIPILGCMYSTSSELQPIGNRVMTAHAGTQSLKNQCQGALTQTPTTTK
ncbi:MAG: hypothetical protein ACJZ5D_01915 [Candidatus Thalassarchaeaceae archaeon]